ncbi:MAG: YHS domain-containing protein [Chloroflexi bacterium]|nr:YHS domain-containing protein [Chloroflexota bacterium]
MEDPVKSHSSVAGSTAKDPICGMDVDMRTAPAKSEYQGKTYYFCAPGCKSQFDKDPDRYITGQQQKGHGHGCCSM